MRATIRSKAETEALRALFFSLHSHNRAVYLIQPKIIVNTL